MTADRRARDHVRLVAGLEHRRVRGVAQRRADHPGQPAEPADQRLDLVPVGRVQVDVHAELLGQRLQELADRLGHHDRELVPADPGDRLGQPGHRVVLVPHRAVAGAAARDQAQPGHALLGGLDRVDPDVVGRSVTLNPPTSLIASVQPSNSSGWLSTRNRAPLTPPASSSATNATTTSRGGRSPRARPLPDHRQQHRVHVLHVDRAAAPDEAVPLLAGERVHRPLARVGGDDVEVAVQQQRRPRTGRCPRSWRPRWPGPAPTRTAGTRRRPRPACR